MSFKKIALIGAMDEEIALFHQHLHNEVLTEHAGIHFSEGFFFGKNVAVCKSGVGKVNAAVCTQVLIDRFKVDAVVFTGVAGALDPSLAIGDIVISTECMQHDVDVTALGFAKGVIPYAEKSIFPADTRLIQKAYDAGHEFFKGRIMKGRVLSGDQFIADRMQVRELYEQMQGACTEMEGAAVAQVCMLNQIPFVVIRSMSDKADGTANVNFPEFMVQAAQNSYRIVEKLIQQLE